MSDIELPISPDEKKKAARFYYFQFFILLLALFSPFDAPTVDIIKSKFLHFHRRESNRLAVFDGLMALLVLVAVLFPAYLNFCIIVIILLLCLRIGLGIRGALSARKGEMKKLF